MKNVHEEIEKEALNQVCLKFNSLEEKIKSLHDAMFRIAEKTAEELRVEKMEKQIFEQYSIDAGYNLAVTQQSKLASKWLGKE